MCEQVMVMLKIAEEQSVAQQEELQEGTDISANEVAMLRFDEGISVEMADWFKTLSDPTRIKIIYALLNKELCVQDLSLVLSMGQSAVSHQLRYLRNVRMVKRRKAGKTVYYSLDDDHVHQIFALTLQHIKHD